MEKFREHESSYFRLEALTMSVIGETHENIGEMFSDTFSQEKYENHQILLKILENVNFLYWRGLPLKGDEKEGNFYQLLMYSSKADNRITEWLKKKTGKYTHPSIEIEFIKIIVLSISTDIASNIHKGVFYTIMADEVTDRSNQEEFVWCLRKADVDLNPHKVFIVPNICADTLIACIQDVLIHMNLTLKNWRGQCFYDARNMSGTKSGEATQIKTKEP